MCYFLNFFHFNGVVSSFSNIKVTFLNTHVGRAQPESRSTQRPIVQLKAANRENARKNHVLLRFLAETSQRVVFYFFSLKNQGCTEKTVYTKFRTLYEILCYPDALWTCSVVTNNLILYVLFHSHYTSNFFSVNFI